MTTEDSRFVYIYTTTKDVPVYVGRGTAARIDDHGADDPNPELAAIIASGDYAIEVLDCGDPKRAILVEGALISAMYGRSKVELRNRRRDTHVFEPLGVPQALGHRRTSPGLTPKEIAAHVGGRVLFVRIGPKSLTDPGRGVIEPGNPADEAIADRLRHYWRISDWIPQWIERPESAPCALVGVSGTKHRYVIGSVDLTDFDWRTVEFGGGVGLPIEPRGDELDAFTLRGRTVLEGEIFAKRQIAQIYDADGRIERGS